MVTTMLFLNSSVIVFIVVTLLIPKRLPRCKLYTTALFSIVLDFITATLVIKIVGF